MARPVPEHDPRAEPDPVGHEVPRHEPAGGVGRRVVAVEVERARARAVAHPGERVDGEATALVLVEVRRPARRRVAVHAVHEALEAGRRQELLELAGVARRAPERPVRVDARVHEGRAERVVGVQEGAAPKPALELVEIVGGEDARERVLRRRLPGAVDDGEEVQVVVAENGDRGRAEVPHEAHRLERGGAAVGDVADEPESIARRVEAGRLEQALERFEATVQVADGPGRHARSSRGVGGGDDPRQCSVRGALSRKSSIGARNSAPSSVTMT